MKFLCPNCKAKYQISDEKITGRTLKMDCRRCNHPIVIRGERDSAVPSDSAARRSSPGRPSSVPAAPPRRRGGSHVGPAPARSPRTALGADFRKNPSAPTAPAKASALDQWHVGINDVPVGPLTREEIGQKIASGAVTGESLAWREGYDEWRPISDIAELSPLLRKQLPPLPAAPGRMPGRLPPPTFPAKPAPARPSPVARAPEPARPAARGNVVPIGGRLGAAAAPSMDEVTDSIDDDDPTRVGSALDLEKAAEEARLAGQHAHALEAEAVPAPIAHAVEDAFDPFGSQRMNSPAVPSPALVLEPAAPVASSPQPFQTPGWTAPEAPRRGLPTGAWIGIAGAVAFGIAFAVMLAAQLFKDQPQPVVVVQPPAPTLAERATDPVLEEPAQAVAIEETQPAADSEQEERAAPSERAARTRSSGGVTEQGAPPPPTQNQQRPLDPEAAARLARFSSDSEGAQGPQLDVQPRNTVLGEERQRANAELTADQIRSVVNRERPAVTRCYETTARAFGQAPSLRLDVDLTIGGGGAVTNTNVRGQSFGNLNECIERTVRRWRFPPSGGVTQTSVPFVFQGRE